MDDIQLWQMLFTNDTSVLFAINSPETGSTRWNSPKSLEKFKVLWKEESPFRENSYGPVSVRPPVGATYTSFQVINEGSNCILLWRFSALEFNSTGSMFRFPTPTEEALTDFNLFWNCFFI